MLEGEEVDWSWDEEKVWEMEEWLVFFVYLAWRDVEQQEEL